MLLGEHEHTIDDKDRLTLPAKFRTAFAAGVVLTRGMDGCLYAYRREDWATLVESRLAELDKQGRVMIPPSLIEHAKLGKEVVVAGVNDRLEIWDRAAWRKELAEVEGSAEDVAERLATQPD